MRISDWSSDVCSSDLSSLSEGRGYLDGRYMAATFNLLRGQDLIWNYVVNNYLLGKEYTPFDLLYWNSDVTNLPAKWHLNYLADLYRDNKLAKGEMNVAGVPIDMNRIKTPNYVKDRKSGVSGKGVYERE